MKSEYEPTYERARQLAAAGCPLDSVEDLRRLRRRIYIETPIESRVIDLDQGSTRYVVGLRIGTDSWKSSTVTDWSFESPWGHHVNFDYAPSDIVPPVDLPFYENFLQPRLTQILNERKSLTCRQSVEGLLTGLALGPIPSFVTNGMKAWGKLTVTDDSGNSVSRRIGLTVDKRPVERTYAAKRRTRLFENRDSVPH